LAEAKQRAVKSWAVTLMPGGIRHDHTLDWGPINTGGPARASRELPEPAPLYDADEGKSLDFHLLIS
jgi:hypothetical protein